MATYDQAKEIDAMGLHGAVLVWGHGASEVTIVRRADTDLSLVKFLSEDDVEAWLSFGDRWIVALEETRVDYSDLGWWSGLK